MNFDSIVALALFAFVSSITPGPNNLMILASGLNFGFLRSIPHWLGITVGFGVMLLGVGSGLHSLFTQYPWAYQLVRVLGASYLLWMAWQLAHSSPPGADTSTSSKPMGFLGAAAFQWVNPKAWVMTLGFFSNYLPQDADVLLIAAASLLFSLINLPSIAVWAVMGARMGHYQQVDLYRRIFNWTMAVLLVASMAASLFMR